MPHGYEMIRDKFLRPQRPENGQGDEFERRQEARGYDLEFNARGHGTNCGQRTEEAETVVNLNKEEICRRRSRF